MSTPAARQPADMLIEPRWIIPIEPAGIVLEGHALVVRGGCIEALLPAGEALARYEPKERLRLSEHILLPGFVNLHTHAAMVLLRGYAEDMPLQHWLERVWAAEARHVNADFVHDGTLLAGAEMLRGGITCFNDMYFFPEAAATAALHLGLRAAIGIAVMDLPTPYASDAEDYLAKGLAARDRLRGEPSISFCLAPHAPYTVGDKTLERIATLAAQLDLPVHTHLHETRREIEQSLRDHGMRPIERLRRLGLLDPRLIAVHAVHLAEEEIAQLAEHGCHVAHCPTSNMKLASGMAPLSPLLRAGVGVGLGTDGAACNNRLDVLREMRHAALLAKVAAMDATVPGPHDVLRMATLGGAAALGLEHRIGSLRPGKQADLCAIALEDWITQPCFDAASHVIYVAGREHVTHVWTDGVLRIDDGDPTGLTQSALREIGDVWHTRMQSRGHGFA